MLHNSYAHSKNQKYIIKKREGRVVGWGRGEGGAQGTA